MGLEAYFLPENLFEEDSNIKQDGFFVLFDIPITFEFATGRSGIGKKKEIIESAFEWFLEKQDSVDDNNMWEASKAIPLISLDKEKFEKAVEIIKDKISEYGEIKGIAFKPASSSNGFEFFRIADFYSAMSVPINKKVNIVLYKDVSSAFEPDSFEDDILDVNNVIIEDFESRNINVDKNEADDTISEESL